MTSNFPFLSLQLPVPPHPGNEQSGNPSPTSPEESLTAPPPFKNSELEKNYAITVKGVQKQFSHLSEEEIFYPPHQLFDAALARQIAQHVMHNELSVPKRRLAIELQRSREMLERALKTVDRRKKRPEFEKTYRLIADDVRDEIVKQKKESK